MNFINFGSSLWTERNFCKFCEFRANCQVKPRNLSSKALTKKSSGFGVFLSLHNICFDNLKIVLPTPELYPIVQSSRSANGSYICIALTSLYLSLLFVVANDESDLMPCKCLAISIALAHKSESLHLHANWINVNENKQLGDDLLLPWLLWQIEWRWCQARQLSLPLFTALSTDFAMESKWKRCVKRKLHIEFSLWLIVDIFGGLCRIFSKLCVATKSIQWIFMDSCLRTQNYP